MAILLAQISIPISRKKFQANRQSKAKRVFQVVDQLTLLVDVCTWALTPLLAPYLFSAALAVFANTLTAMFIPPGVASVNGLLYVVGGDDGSCNLVSVEYYNPRTDSWTLLPTTMSTGRSYAGVAVIDKLLWRSADRVIVMPVTSACASYWSPFSVNSISRFVVRTRAIEKQNYLARPFKLTSWSRYCENRRCLNYSKNFPSTSNRTWSDSQISRSRWRVALSFRVACGSSVGATRKAAAWVWTTAASASWAPTSRDLLLWFGSFALVERASGWSSQPSAPENLSTSLCSFS